jgi:NYN domain
MDDDLTRTSLLIDADNVNVEVLAQVLRLLDDGSRRLQHRRAYGSLQKAGEFATLCEQHAIRFIATTYAGTNGTDVALTIDAIELARDEPTDEFVLVTSDCDFLPLAARLRELGFVVRGYGQEGKSPRDTADYLRVYDSFKVIVGTALPKPRGVARKPAAPRDVSREAAAAAPASTVSMLRPPLDDELRRILEAVPALLEGEKVELGTAAAQLRAAQLLARNAPSTKLFKKYPQHFELTPTRQPNQVQYRAR